MSRYSPVFVRLTLNKEEWERKIEVDEHSVRLRRIKGYKPPRHFEWQWDGETFSVAPGEDIVVDEEVAKAGLRASMVFPRDRTPDGQELMEYDHNGVMFPMLEIVERFNATDPTELTHIPEQKQQRCPFCKGDFDSLEDHLPECNLSGLVSEAKEENDVSLDAMKADLDKKMEAMKSA